MQKHEAPQKIDPEVLTLRWNNEEMKEIILKHMLLNPEKMVDVDLSNINTVSLWYEEEPFFIEGVHYPYPQPPHHGYVMRITKKIK